MRTAQALEMVRHRDRALAAVLEAERDQGWPAPFDWRRWRLDRALLVAKANRRVDADERLDQLFARVIHSTVETLNAGQ